MPFPRWLARINKRVFNPGQISKGKRPVIAHVGRSSGAAYRTPLDAHPTKGGWVLVARYGPHSDWVLNALAAGRFTLRVDGTDHELVAPRLATVEEATTALAPGYTPPADFFKAEHYLLADHAP
jgi:deazaflavin-dependent oxidoreductase (nitroreductase family)